MTRQLVATAMISMTLLAPVQATALSCAPMPDSILVLNQARLMPDEVIVGYGTFAMGEMLDGPAANSPNAETAKFQFDGVMFAEDAIISIDPTVSVTSTGCTHEIWCNGLGHPIVDVPSLVVFDRAASTGQLSVFSGLCGSSIILPAANLDVDAVATCLAGGTCTVADFGY